MRMLILSLAAMALGGGCGDDGQVKPPADAPPLYDASSDASAATCFSGTPITHEQIINACTSAQGIDKSSKPALLLPDGSLPPLPP